MENVEILAELSPGNEAILESVLCKSGRKECTTYIFLLLLLTSMPIAN